MTKKILAIYRSMVDEEGTFLGHEVWLSDETDTYYIGTNTGVVGPHGSSTGYFQYFNAEYDLYSVAEELFGHTDIKLVNIELN